ncbi:MAG: HEPN domain-containing protein [Thermoplasmatales archaeon]|nr:HEPN domain-containing protein [Thermoplasmatales archaeon]
MFDKEEFERWIKQAEKTFESAVKDKNNGDYNWCCFKAQQAGEYAVKGLLYGLGIFASGHSIVNLLGKIKDLEKEEILREARLLDRHYIPPRYPNAHPEGTPFEYYDAETAEEALRASKKIIDFVKRGREKWK